jgi:hypothetical protein
MLNSLIKNQPREGSCDVAARLLAHEDHALLVISRSRLSRRTIRASWEGPSYHASSLWSECSSYACSSTNPWRGECQQEATSQEQYRAHSHVPLRDRLESSPILRAITTRITTVDSQHSVNTFMHICQPDHKKSLLYPKKDSKRCLVSPSVTNVSSLGA